MHIFYIVSCWLLSLSVALFPYFISKSAYASDTRQNISLQIENDLFATDSDRHYTHGTRMEYVSDENKAPKWLLTFAKNVPLFLEAGKTRYSFAIGQSIYTPSDNTLEIPNRNDRPYAGWAYISNGLISDGGNRLDNIELSIGVVGKSSQAGKTQKWVHRHVSNSPDPKGWGAQLKNEPTININYERMWRIMHTRSLYWLEGDIIPSAGAALGNAFTDISVGAMFRLGHILPTDYGPPRIRPSLPGSAFFKSSGKPSGYLFTGVMGRLVGRNIFLDGNTFSSSHSVEKKNFVADLQFGGVVTWKNVRLSYTQILRTEEFVKQNKPDRFGSFNISLSF